MCRWDVSRVFWVVLEVSPLNNHSQIPCLPPPERLEKIRLKVPVTTEVRRGHITPFLLTRCRRKSSRGPPFTNKVQKPTRSHLVPCLSSFFLPGMQREALSFARLSMSGKTGGTWVLNGTVIWLCPLSCLPPREKIDNGDFFY